MMKKIFVLFLTTLFFSCTEKENQENKLHLFTWSHYFSPDVLKQFEEETNSRIQLSYFSSNEELLTKLQAGARGYDVIVPSGYLIKAMKALSLLERLEASAWPEHQFLQKRFQNSPEDPKLEYSLPFAWGLSALAINKKKVQQPIEGWNAVFGEKLPWSGQITMLDDAPEVVGAAMKYLGYGINESSPEALQKAKDLLKRQKKKVKAYTSETLPLLQTGDMAVAHAFSSDILQAKQKNPSIELVIPKEGGVYWVDYLAIPKGVQNKQLAIAFLKFMLRPAIASLQSEYIKVYPVVTLTKPGTVTIPTEQALEKFESITSTPAHHNQLIRIWTELKASD